MVLPSLLTRVPFFFLGKLVFHPENASRGGRCRKEGWEALRKVVWTVFSRLSFYKYIDLYIQRDSSLKTGEKFCWDVDRVFLI